MRTFRRIIPIVALTATLVLSSCSTFSNDAARVDGQSYSVDELDDLLVGYAAATNQGDVTVDGTLPSDSARELLSSWVVTSVKLGLIEAAGESLSDADLAAASEMLNAQPGFADADENVRDFFVWTTAVTTKLNLTLAPDATELESLYESGPVDSGVVCVRAILVATEDDINAVVLRLLAGEDFAAIAADASIDPSGADGGVLAGTAGSACLDFATVSQSVAPSFVDALSSTAVGDVSTPFEIADTGWAVVLPRPFDEVADDLAVAVGSRFADEASRDAMASAHIWVSPKYGRWDPSTNLVVSLG